MGYVVALLVFFMLAALGSTMIGFFVLTSASLAFVAALLVSFVHWMLYGCPRPRFGCVYDAPEIGTVFVVCWVIVVAAMGFLFAADAASSERAQARREEEERRRREGGM